MKRAMYKKSSLKAKRSSFISLCNKTTDHYGNAYKTVIKERINPSELFKILGQPEAGDSKLMAYKNSTPNQATPFHVNHLSEILQNNHSPVMNSKGSSKSSSEESTRLRRDRFRHSQEHFQKIVSKSCVKT
ncbi:hypothetical protein AVEN_52479-1 [Araneus ventricosus]|uniref:Uncharacterized protein n=1 Tax=Araneus ventricosus TaxID=182803 RepID=A0A4Y2CY37_ARAVE|nr:hypothetical protein AVEN_52479-1 [Araneus ventricosus]